MTKDKPRYQTSEGTIPRQNFECPGCGQWIEPLIDMAGHFLKDNPPPLSCARCKTHWTKADLIHQIENRWKLAETTVYD